MTTSSDDEMTADELTTAMRAAIEDERRGIRGFDAAAVERANETKAFILRRLQETPAPRRAALYAALDELKPELYRNLTLLTHAQAFLREQAQQWR